MRKWIIKLFALDYIVNVGGTKVNFTRSANIIFPSLLGTMTLSACHSPLWWIAALITLIGVFFGFFYFKFKPLNSSDIHYFDDCQLYSWWVFNKRRHVPELRNFNGTWVLTVNPIAIMIFLSILILKFH
nr:MAG TPA: hypothetical protein [Caudoviricetes sp.]